MKRKLITFLTTFSLAFSLVVNTFPLGIYATGPGGVYNDGSKGRYPQPGPYVNNTDDPTNYCGSQMVYEVSGSVYCINTFSYGDSNDSAGAHNGSTPSGYDSPIFLADNVIHQFAVSYAGNPQVYTYANAVIHNFPAGNTGTSKRCTSNNDASNNGIDNGPDANCHSSEEGCSAKTGDAQGVCLGNGPNTSSPGGDCLKSPPGTDGKHPPVWTNGSDSCDSSISEGSPNELTCRRVFVLWLPDSIKNDSTAPSPQALGTSTSTPGALNGYMEYQYSGGSAVNENLKYPLQDLMYCDGGIDSMCANPDLLRALVGQVQCNFNGNDNNCWTNKEYGLYYFTNDTNGGQHRDLFANQSKWGSIGGFMLSCAPSQSDKGGNSPDPNWGPQLLTGLPTVESCLDPAQHPENVPAGPQGALGYCLIYGQQSATGNVEVCSDPGYSSTHTAECNCIYDTNTKTANGNTYTALGCIPSNFAAVVNIFLSIAIAIGGVAALIMMIVGGYEIMTNPAGPDEIQEGKDYIINGVLGLLVIIFCVVILRIIGVDILGIAELGKLIG